MKLTGTSWIGFTKGTAAAPFLQAVNPATSELLEPHYHAASAAEIEQALALAESAFTSYRMTSAQARAEFLRCIANELEARTEDIVVRATAETGLAEARIRSELGRTMYQCRSFADMLDDGAWLDARIDHAMPERAPLPKPDLRSMLRPLGPVVVFCASNFPLAYSVAGGDTASALAVGCPVIVRAHSAHPGTAELAADAIISAAQKCNLPQGVFSLLYGEGNDIGQTLVTDSRVKAVGFTGSRKGGRALMDAASNRPEPIPVYAEMSSVNPMIFLPDTLSKNAAALAQGYIASLTLGVGQFCTNPGLAFVEKSQGSELIEAVRKNIAAAQGGVMLHQGIAENYSHTTQQACAAKGVTIHSGSKAQGICTATPLLLEISATDFLAQPFLMAEMFGPASVLVIGTIAEITQAAEALEGQLTATIHGTPDDLAQHKNLLEIIERKAGRLIINGFPTGVEVCPSMVHGGPYPATSDGRSTSVGTMAAARFCRAVCYQNFPNALLPDELKDENPLGIPRMVH